MTPLQSNTRHPQPEGSLTSCQHDVLDPNLFMAEDPSLSLSKSQCFPPKPLEPLRRLCDAIIFSPPATPLIIMPPPHDTSVRYSILALEQMAQTAVRDFIKKKERLLFRAIDGNDLDSISFLKTKGVSFYAKNAKKETPLTYAIRSGQHACIQLLLELGAEPNALDGNEQTPLCVSAQKGDEKAICLLCAKTSIAHQHSSYTGADINQSDPFGNTALTIAISAKNLPLIELLLQLGADPNKPNFEERTPLVALLATDGEIDMKIVRLLEQAGARAFEPRYIAGVWGIRGTVSRLMQYGRKNEMDLEGTTIPSFVYRKFQEIVTAFFSKKLKGDLLTQEEKTLVLRVLQQGEANSAESFSFQSLVEKIRKNAPFFMLLTQPHHIIGSVWNNGTLMLCNRGDGATEHAIEAYTYDPLTISDEFLKDMVFCSSGEQFIWLLEKLQKDGALTHRYGLDQNHQKVGNCSWTSTESAFLALLYIALQESHPDADARWTLAREVYKSFTTFARISCLEEYMQYSSQPNLDLLQLISPKLKSLQEKGSAPHSVSKGLEEASKKALQQYVLALFEREKISRQILDSLDQPNTPLPFVFERHRLFLCSIGAKEGDSFEALRIALQACIRFNHRALGLLAFQAIDANDIESLSFLKKEGISLDEQRWSGETPLIHAIDTGRRECALHLLRLGANPNIASDRWSPLSIAVDIRDVDLVCLLKASGASLNRVSIHQRTALTHAVAVQNVPLVSVLLDEGADPNVPDGLGMTALTQAILLENTSLQKLLEERGAKIDQKGTDAILRATIHQKKVSLMKRFLTHDVDLDSKHEGCTTIECLCEEILHYFVSRGVGLNQLYHDGHTHLTYAIHWGDLPLVQMLLRAGANPNAKDREEKTPLAIARDEHRDEIIQCLEGFGAQDVVV